MLRQAILALLVLAPAAAQAQDLDRAKTAVVRITGTRDGASRQGSGFVVALEGDKTMIVTASHVIEGLEPLQVTFAADRTTSYPVGLVLGMEAGNPRGLALFQVQGKLPVGITTLSFETSDSLQLGEELFVLGFPNRAASPIALRMALAGLDGNLLQLDRPAEEGASGSPVLRRGRVAGVVVEEESPRLTLAVDGSVARSAVVRWGVKLGDPSMVAPGSELRGAAAPTRCKVGEEIVANGITFVHICGGTYTMVSLTTFYLESPPPVTLSDFWLGKTEITNEQYRRVHRDHSGDADLPATGVTWKEAKDACVRLGGRLPTEAEWEYASRAGSPTQWPSGVNEKNLGDYEWYEGNSGGKAHPVGTRKANQWGLYDMFGNVMEWVADWYSSSFTGTAIDPKGPTKGKGHVLRVFSYADKPEGDLRSTAMRLWAEPSYKAESIGFRCARDDRRRP